MRNKMMVFIAAVAGVAAVPAIADAPAGAAPAAAAPQKAKYTTADTDIGTLLDDPAAKAILAKHIPGLVDNDQIDMARSMTLRGIQNYSPDELTDERLAAIDADLAKLK